MSGTLYITGNSAADALLNSNGTALMIGMLLDQQVPMEWAFKGAHTLRQRLGHLDPARIAAMDPESFLAVCLDRPAIHRFPKAMAGRIQGLCALLEDRYEGRAENIWRGVDDASVLFSRLREFPGFGEEKAQIFVALLAKRFGVKPRGWKRAAGVFSDSKPRTVADITSPATLAKVRAWKKAEKEADRDKQSRPLVGKTAGKQTTTKNGTTKKTVARRKPAVGK
ncbi:MAG: Fe-S cluster assembly protein HesB [Actinobacteria bacterium]|nr:Fe-S cluster assembly protein HesB [Actinomycetota bacterium]